MTRRGKLEVERAKKSVLKPSEAHKLMGEELMMLMKDGEVKDQGNVDHKNVNDQIRASALMNRARETHRVKMDSLQRLHPSEAHIITKDEKMMMGEDLIQEDSKSKEGIDKGNDDNIRDDHNLIAGRAAKALGVNLDELFWIFGGGCCGCGGCGSFADTVWWLQMWTNSLSQVQGGATGEETVDQDEQVRTSTR